METDRGGTDTGRRRPGRPRKSEDEHERDRAVIVAAAERVLARRRYRDVTVTRVIEAAGITRAAFYRSFPNVDEPLRRLIDQAAGELRREVHLAVADSGTNGTSGSASVVAALDVFLAWAGRHRAVLSTFVVDGRDESSPVYAVHREVTDAFVDLIGLWFTAAGRTVPPRAVLDVFVTSVEYTAHRTGLDDDMTPEQARDLVMRLAAALLGSADSIQRLAESLRSAARQR